MRASSGLIVKLVQRQCLQDDYIALGSGKQVKASSRLANLSPILLDGVIHVGGRLQNAPICTEAIHPMIVPNEHPVAILIIRHYHQTVGHVGREHVLAALHQCYWILNARVLTRQVLRHCIDCCKRHEASMRQFMGELSRARLTPYKPPFTYTGLDFFGPFHVKRGRSIEKVYRCIFSCLTTRAIHIEDVGSLETDAFIQALRRFICIQGAAKEIWSDNGTNFIGGEKELKLARQEWNQTAIKHALHEKEVEWRCQPFQKWHFQPPTASHISGVWERLIRSVRMTMKAVLGHPHAFVSRKTLRTVFAEAIGILNARPLCPSSDPTDWEPITPSHLLQQCQGLATRPGNFQDEEVPGAEGRFSPITSGRDGYVSTSHFYRKGTSGS